MQFRVLQYKSVDSTNNLAREFAEGGAAEGTIVSADYQTSGRGRFDRKWQSPKAAGLLFSVILRPKVKASEASMLTHLAAKSVAKTLKDVCGLSPALKKPNDVLVAKKKIAGILTESCGKGRNIDFVILGIGININTTKAKMLKTATSARAETGKRYERGEVLDSFLTEFESNYEKWAK